MLNKTILAFFAILFFAFPVFGQDFDKTSIENYILRFRSLAMEEQVRTGVPAAITLAQGIFETGAGTSELCTNAHNHFGIKCKGNWTGETYSYDDDRPSECFRKYSNPLQSFKDHSDFLRNNVRYARLFQLKPTNYKDWAEGLKVCGYATNKHYAKKLIGYIEQYNLEQYTEQAMSGNVLANAAPDTDGQNGQLLADSDTPLAVQEQARQSPVTHTYHQAAAKTAEEQPLSYYITTQKNGLKGFYGRQGDLLLEYAIAHHVRYGKLLVLNDLPDEPLEADMFVYLERKRKTGLQPYFKVEPGMDLLQVSQETGVALDQLRILNHLKKGEEPVSGVLLALQKSKSDTIQIVAQNIPRVENESRDRKEASDLPDAIALQKSPVKNEVQQKPEYIYLKHQTTEKVDADKTVEQESIAENKDHAVDFSLRQKEDSLEKAAVVKLQKKEVDDEVTESANEGVVAPSNNEVAPQKELSQTEKLRAMMDKIVYADGQESERKAIEPTAGNNSKAVSKKRMKEQKEAKVDPTERLRVYMSTVKDQHKVGEGNYTTLPAGQVKDKPAAERESDSANDTKYYTVQQGDTAYRISKQFGISLTQLKNWNHLPASMSVSVGARLKVAP